MTQPKVTITELDGALGVLPPSAGKLLALVGPCQSGTANQPATFGKVKDVKAFGTRGPLVEAACHAIERYGNPVIIVKTGMTTAGIAGAVTSTATGTSVVTITGTPDDDYELYLIFIAGGTRGVTGATFKYSLDGGRTLSPVQSLGTALLFAIPESGLTVNFAAGTFVAGDYHTSRCVAPAWTASELGTAFDALALSPVQWGIVEIVGPVDATSFDTIELKIAAMAVAGKYRMWMGNTRLPTTSETEATYLTAMNTIFSAKSTTSGALCYGAEKLTSSVSGRKYKRPIVMSRAAFEANLSEEQNAANINLGAAIGVSIRDNNGNPDEHDESANPGADDARFYVNRTWDGVQGVYVNRPRLFSADGSDFQLVPHRRVMNLAHEALRAYFIRRLNKPVRVNATTGYILEEEAAEIEAGARAVLRASLLAKPKASGIDFVLSRTDNLLSTKTMTGTARIIPLAYPEFINLDLGFLNPALQVVAA